MRVMISVVALAFLVAACSNAKTEPTAIASKSATSTFAISAGHSYDLTGTYKFETLFSDMQGFNSPTVSGSAPDGAFVFNPPSSTSPGGVIQIKFVSVQSNFAFACIVGSPGSDFALVVSGPDGRKDIKGDAGNDGSGNNVLKFETGPMRVQGDLLVRISRTAATSVWNLYRCDVAPK